ncbi:CoA ester lyase [Achromobacter sp. GG226]|uniref:HpcH/HpaI aldolase/citrate lyase family protein n=1 Tax=Verticiella alkaliphila TaxID=2779529 RepID=UPI001C0DC121|nr:CoA ester lyase [Verticiella sp. GG226]MBU4611459.1 CoA ester lyase [Verticiella sp. GG226]
MKSKLFVPASRPELFDKAFASAADALSFDLEDAVAASRKGAAREALRAWLAQLAPPYEKKIIVRVNAPDTDDFADDLTRLAGLPVHLVNVPKLETAAQVQSTVAALDAAGIAADLLITIETPGALAQATGIAKAHARVQGLQLGLADLFEPLGIDRHDPATLRQVMLTLRLAAGEAGKYVLDAAYANVGDPDGFRAEAMLSRRLGYLGKSCIHPSQIALANSVYGFSPEEIAHARRLVDESERQPDTGAFLLDGKMIDAPFVRRARDILLAAGQ